MCKYYRHKSLTKNISDRTEDDDRLIELLLGLLKNLLLIPDALPTQCSGRFNKTHMHDDLIIQFQKVIFSRFAQLYKEHILELLLVLSENIEEKENEGWKFLLLEILCLLMRKETPLQLIQTYDTYQKEKERKANPAPKTRGTLGTLLDQEKKKKSLEGKFWLFQLLSPFQAIRRLGGTFAIEGVGFY